VTIEINIKSKCHRIKEELLRPLISMSTLQHFNSGQGRIATTKEYRGRHEIIAQILHNVSNGGSEGIKKTMIMYRSSLSYFQLKEYLSVLIENGLVEKSPWQIDGSSYDGNANEKFLFKITEKGLRFLHISQEIESLMGNGSMKTLH
jgi:predicted transcriptional regulator